MPPTNSYIPEKYEPLSATGYAGASVGLPLVEPDQDDLRSTSLDEAIRDPSSKNSPIQYPTPAQSHQSTTRVPIETIAQTKEKNSCHQSSNTQLDTATTCSISDACEQVTGVLETSRNNQNPRTNVVIETTALPVEPGHIAKELFAFCMKAYQSSLPIIIGLDIDKTRAKMQEEMGRLALWGDSYTVSEGELDILFKSSKDKYLKESTIILLCSIAKTLNSCLSTLNTYTSQETSQDSNSSATPPHTAEPTSRLNLTKALVGASSGKDLNTKGLYDLHSEAKINARPAIQEVPRANQYSADEFRPEMRHSLQALLNVVQGLMPEIAGLIEQDSSDDDGDDGDPLDFRSRLSEVVEDIKDSLDSLFDLVPSIDELCLVTEETIAKEHGQARVSTIEPAEIPTLFEAQAYKINIQDKFPEVEEQLAETLARVNWARHRRIREWAENHESKGQVQVTHGPTGTIFTDSAIGSSSFTFQCILPPTQKNPFSDCRSETSATSFGTTNSTMSGGIRIPKAPVPLSPGIIFECPICFKMLRGIDTNILWKKHVLRDLKPYSCIFSSCSEKNTTFESRKAWVAHEFNHHRPQNYFEWRCSGSCGEVYRKREEFVRHVLRDHLEGTTTASDIGDIVDNCRTEAPRGSISCPLCTECIPETKRSFQRHIGTHMDEIALKALPINFECESNASSRGEDSEDEGITSDSDTILNNFLAPNQPHIAIEPGEFLLPWPSDIESDVSFYKKYNSPPPNIFTTIDRPLGYPKADKPLIERNSTGRTQLHRACQRGAITEVEAILGQGKELLNVEDNAGYFPLHKACLYGHLEVAKILVNNGAWLDMPSRSEQGTPLFFAVDNGHADVVKYLLEMGADPRKKDMMGRTFLNTNDLNRETPEVFQEIEEMLKAAVNKLRSKRSSDDEAAINKLGLESSSDDEISIGNRHSPRAHAPSISGPVHKSPPTSSIPTGVRRRNSRMEQSRKDLLWLDVCLQKLRERAREGDQQMVHALLERGTKPDTEALVEAIKGGHADIVSLLLAYGDGIVDPEPWSSQNRNMRDNQIPAWDETPMLSAIGRGNLTVLGYLLASGVNPRRLDSKGKSYMEIARDRKGDFWQEEVEMLKKAWDKAGRGISEGDHSAANKSIQGPETEINSIPSEDKDNIGNTTETARDITFIESGPDDSFGEINCICGFSDDDGLTICCDKCGTWQHIVCVQLMPEDLPASYCCPRCSPRPLDIQKARDIQRHQQAEVQAERGHRKRQPVLVSKKKQRRKDDLNSTTPRPRTRRGRRGRSLPDQSYLDCPFPGCSCVGLKGFVREDDLIDHRRMVHNEVIPKEIFRSSEGASTRRFRSDDAGAVGKAGPVNGDDTPNHTPQTY